MLTTAQHPRHTISTAGVIDDEVVVAQRQSVNIFRAIAVHVCVQKAGVCFIGIVQPVLQCMPQAQLLAQYMAIVHCGCPVPITHGMPGGVEEVLHFTNVAGGILVYELNLCSLCNETL